MTTDTYYSNGNEVQLFEQAYHQRLPVMLTGPTGCGKTRFVEHMGAAAATARGHHQLPRRPHQLRSRRPLHGDRRRRGVDRRAAHQSGQGRRDLLPGRGRGGTPRLAGHPALAHRPPPRSVSGPGRRGGRSAGDVHARVLVQPRLPQLAQGAQAVLPSAVRHAADEVSAARPRGRGDRRRSRHRLVDSQAACPVRDRHPHRRRGVSLRAAVDAGAWSPRRS